jgi:hypothetical protein
MAHPRRSSVVRREVEETRSGGMDERERTRVVSGEATSTVWEIGRTAEWRRRVRVRRTRAVGPGGHWIGPPGECIAAFRSCASPSLDRSCRSECERSHPTPSLAQRLHPSTSSRDRGPFCGLQLRCRGGLPQARAPERRRVRTAKRRGTGDSSPLPRCGKPWLEVDRMSRRRGSTPDRCGRTDVSRTGLGTGPARGRRLSIRGAGRERHAWLRKCPPVFPTEQRRFPVSHGVARCGVRLGAPTGDSSRNPGNRAPPQGLHPTG